MIMPRHYIGERTVHDVGNFKDFCGSKDSKDEVPKSSGSGLAAADDRRQNNSCGFKRLNLGARRATTLNRLNP
jgi:hypothetical protein